MYRLWKHKNGTYYALHGPRQRRRTSLRTDDRKEAEIRLHRLAVEQADLKPDVPTIGQIIDGYEAEHLPQLRSQAAQRRCLAHVRRHFEHSRPTHIAQKAVRDYAAARAKDGVKPGTILREVGALRAVLSWAVKHKWIPRSDKPVISNPVAAPKPRDRWITREEAKRLLTACHEPHVRLFVRLALMTVPRMSALLEARWDQVKWEERLIDYGQGHGYKRRAIVPLNDEVFGVLQAARQLRQSEWIVEYHGKPVKTLKHAFAVSCRRAGLADVTPHILRHSGATWMALAGVPMREIARMLGDSETTTERVYAKYHPAYLRRAAGALQIDGAPEQSALQ